MYLERFWNGRKDSDAHSTRFHQEVLTDMSATLEVGDFGLIGFESDEGVRRNQGNPGAALAPNVIRTYIGNLPFHMKHKQVKDYGNITCILGDLEGAQTALGQAVTGMLEDKVFPIMIGGGHETFYGHFLGEKNFRAHQSIGIINIDAHFDMRPDETPSSGTMFRQALEANDDVGYLCLGIQELGNTKTLFDAAARFKVQYMLEDEMHELSAAYEKIDQFAANYDAVIVTVCMDAIASSFAPGVSAPSPFGLEAKQVRSLLRHIATLDNVSSMDVSEVNPLVDEKDKTSRLAALLVADFMQHIAKNNS